MIKIVYDLLKDQLNIVKLTFTSGVNAASEEYEPRLHLDRCPLCGLHWTRMAFAPSAAIARADGFSDRFSCSLFEVVSAP